MSKIFCVKRWNDVPFAHRQHLHDGHCALIHGHNWDIEVTFSSEKCDENGFVIDFGKLKPFKDEISSFDHALVLREDDPLGDHLPEICCNLISLPDASSEGLARYFYQSFSRLLAVHPSFSEPRDRGVSISSVKVHEDSKNSAVFEP